jgi:AGCS family alanine or glycine:cation symporter
LIVSLGLIFFAATTLFGWGYYGERAAEYLFGVWIIKPYRYLWVVLAFVGAVAKLSLVCTFADIMNALMAFPNLIALLLLSGTVFTLSRAAFRAEKEKPGTDT